MLFLEVLIAFDKREKKRGAGKILHYTISYETEKSIIKGIILNGTGAISKRREAIFLSPIDFRFVTYGDRDDPIAAM